MLTLSHAPNMTSEGIGGGYMSTFMLWTSCEPQNEGLIATSGDDDEKGLARALSRRPVVSDVDGIASALAAGVDAALQRLAETRHRPPPPVTSTVFPSNPAANPSSLGSAPLPISVGKSMATDEIET